MGESRKDSGLALAYCAGASAAILAVAAAGVIWSRKWALRAYAGGTADYLRDGPAFGQGSVVWFRFKRDAEAMLAALRPALADNVAVRVERYRRRR